MALKEKSLYFPNLKELQTQKKRCNKSLKDLEDTVEFERDGNLKIWNVSRETLGILFNEKTPPKPTRRFEGKHFIVLAKLFDVDEETLIRKDVAITDPEKGVLQFFDFGKADDALKALLGLQTTLKAQKVRVVCFTGHKLDGFFGKLMDKQRGIASVDIFMGTKEMAHRMEMTRQEEIFQDWWGLDGKDLRRHFFRNKGEPKVRLRFFDCPPTFTGVALGDSEGDSAFLIVYYLYLPTLDWLRKESKESATKHDEFWQSLGIFNIPEDDDTTLNALAMPAVLVVKGDGSGPNEDAFRVYSNTFETVWKTLDRDWDRPPGNGRYEPFAEMTRLFTQKNPGGAAKRR